MSDGTYQASPAQERKYKKFKKEIIAEVKSLRLNQARIDSLVEQLYDINKKLVSNEGRLMRLAESHGVARADFLKNYQGSETTMCVRLWRLTVYDCSRSHVTQTNISLFKLRARLADSISLSRNSPLQRSQRDEGGGSTRVRI